MPNTLEDLLNFVKVLHAMYGGDTLYELTAAYGATGDIDYDLRKSQTVKVWNREENRPTERKIVYIATDICTG